MWVMYQRSLAMLHVSQGGPATIPEMAPLSICFSQKDWTFGDRRSPHSGLRTMSRLITIAKNPRANQGFPNMEVFSSSSKWMTTGWSMAHWVQRKRPSGVANTSFTNLRWSHGQLRKTHEILTWKTHIFGITSLALGPQAGRHWCQCSRCHRSFACTELDVLASHFWLKTSSRSFFPKENQFEETYYYQLVGPNSESILFDISIFEYCTVWLKTIRSPNQMSLQQISLCDFRAQR